MTDEPTTAEPTPAPTGADHIGVLTAALAGDWPRVRTLLAAYRAVDLYALGDVMSGIEREMIETARAHRGKRPGE